MHVDLCGPHMVNKNDLVLCGPQTVNKANDNKCWDVTYVVTTMTVSWMRLDYIGLKLNGKNLLDMGCVN